MTFAEQMVEQARDDGASGEQLQRLRGVAEFVERFIKFGGDLRTTCFTEHDADKLSLVIQYLNRQGLVRQMTIEMTVGWLLEIVVLDEHMTNYRIRVPAEREAAELERWCKWVMGDWEWPK